MNFINYRLFALLFCNLFTIFLFAQDYEYGSKVERSNPKASLGLHLGIGFSDINADRLAYPITETNLRRLDRQTNISPRLGIQLLIHINETTAFETGVLYEKLGVKAKGYYDQATETVIDFGDSKTTFSYEYITVPLLFKKIFNETGKVNVAVHVGPYFGFLQTASYGFKTVILMYNTDGSISETTNEFSSSLKDQTRKTEMGLRVQLAAERKVSEMATIYISSFYSRGIRQIDDFQSSNPGDLSEGKHRSFGFSVGGYFRMM